MLKIVLTSSESNQYLSAPNEISEFPLVYMTGYFCRSVYIPAYIHKKTLSTVISLALLIEIL